MENLQRELTNYYRKKIDNAMKEEIANRAASDYKINVVYSCHLPYDDIRIVGEVDLLQQATINAIDTIIEEWRARDYDVEPYGCGNSYGVYWN